MKVPTNLTTVLTLFLITNTLVLVLASNFNAQSYLSSVWHVTNLPSQASITPFAEALSTAKASMDRAYDSAWTSAGNSAVSKYHITGVGSWHTSTIASGPAALATPAPAAYAAAVGGIVGAAMMVVV